MKYSYPNGAPCALHPSCKKTSEKTSEKTWISKTWFSRNRGFGKAELTKENLGENLPFLKTYYFGLFSKQNFVTYGQRKRETVRLDKEYA